MVHLSPLILKSAGVTVAVVILAQASILGVNTMRAAKPILGLKFHGHTVAWQSDQQLQHIIDTTLSDLEDQRTTIKAGNYREKITARQLGATYSRDDLLKRVRSQGRKGNLMHRLVVQDKAVFGLENERIGYPDVNQTVVHEYIKRVGGLINKKPVDAHFTYSNNQITIVPDTPGTHLDDDKALTAVTSYDSNLSSSSIDLPITHEQAHISQKSLEPVLPKLQQIVQKPLTIAADQKLVTIPPDQLFDLITVNTQDTPTGAVAVDVGFKQEKISAKLDELSKQVDIAPKPTITVGDTVVKQGQPGLRVDGQHAKVEVVAVLMAREQPATTPTAPTQDHNSTDVVHLGVDHLDPPVVTKKPEPAKPSGQFPAYNPPTGGNQGNVTLTFDDGPNGTYTDMILDILKHYHVHAIFFLVGKNTENFPDVAKRIVAEGHTVGNHSFTHSNLATFSENAVTVEVKDTQASIGKITGITPKLFRPPYGSLNQTVKNVVSGAGLDMMLWSNDPRDWSSPGSSVITQRVLAGLTPGANILLHVLHEQTVSALPAIIEGIQNKGYGFN